MAEEQGNEYIPNSANDDAAAEVLNKAFAVPEDCADVSEVWQRALNEGLIIPGFEKLEGAVEALKSAITKDMLYDGPTEEIHDNNVVVLRADLIGRIGGKLNNYIENGSPIIDIHTNLGNEMNALKGAIDAAKSDQTKEALKAFIRLHFYCFKNCNKTECLEMD